MVEETIDEIDHEGNVIATWPRSRLAKRMFMHRVSLIVPITEDGLIVLAKRARNKHPYPGLWLFASGGKSSSGESPEATAARELKEELNLSCPLKRISSFVYDEEEYMGLFTLFITAEPISVEDIKIERKEIDHLKAFPIEEAIASVKKSPERYAPTFTAGMRELEIHKKEIYG